jgi:hypothetical protein
VDAAAAHTPWLQGRRWQLLPKERLKAQDLRARGTCTEHAWTKRILFSSLMCLAGTRASRLGLERGACVGAEVRQEERHTALPRSSEAGTCCKGPALVPACLAVESDPRRHAARLRLLGRCVQPDHSPTASACRTGGRRCLCCAACSGGPLQRSAAAARLAAAWLLQLAGGGQREARVSTCMVSMDGSPSPQRQGLTESRTTGMPSLNVQSWRRARASPSWERVQACITAAAVRGAAAAGARGGAGFAAAGCGCGVLVNHAAGGGDQAAGRVACWVHAEAAAGSCAVGVGDRACGAPASGRWFQAAAAADDVKSRLCVSSRGAQSYTWRQASVRIGAPAARAVFRGPV